RSFTFDRVFPSESDQRYVYEGVVEAMVKKFCEGYNVTIMAYGQTCSGKSYTMGTSLDGNDDGDAGSQVGVISRAIDTLFGIVGDKEHEMRVTFVELYNEDIVDLFSQKSKSIQIREDVNGSIVLVGVTEENVRNASEVIELMRRGLLNRSTGSTDMNLVSSRSHAIFSVCLRQMRDGVSVISKMNFVDLAGSERLKRTNATGDRARESISINSGLLALGNVISALGDESRRGGHVPYRDSKLTRLLQDSLGGNSQTLMMACVSPADSNFMETLNTLKYANRARNIKNKAMINEE
ncbi:kinesin-domain-containing protein, partial [Rozella allomycis CSF55]